MIDSMEAAAATRSRLIRRGVSLEVFTLGWMTVEAGVAVAAGIAAGSVALIVFYIDSAIEFVAASVVLREFRAEQIGRARPALIGWVDVQPTSLGPAVAGTSFRPYAPVTPLLPT